MFKFIDTLHSRTETITFFKLDDTTRHTFTVFRWWRCIHRWLGAFSPNLRQIFRNVDL